MLHWCKGITSDFLSGDEVSITSWSTKKIEKMRKKNINSERLQDTEGELLYAPVVEMAIHDALKMHCP